MASIPFKDFLRSIRDPAGYPYHVCKSCVQKHGSAALTQGYAPDYIEGRCGLCGQKTDVADPRAFGFPKFDVVPRIDPSLSLCAMCAKIQDTCCCGPDVYLTKGDVRRISAATGLNGPALYEYRAADEEAWESSTYDTAWRKYAFTSEGYFRALRVREERFNPCILLSNDGCTLPRDVRPLVCRLFPRTFTEDGLDDVEFPLCPTYLLPAEQTVCQSLGLTDDQLEQWRAQLYLEMREEEPSF